MNAVLAEWTKLRTLRSTFWTLLLTIVLCVGLGYLLGLTFRSFADPTGALFATFYSITLGQLPLVVFGVLAIGAEYSTGTIRAALTATPKRGAFYLAKIAVTGLISLTVAAASTVTTFFAAQAGLGPLAARFDLQGIVGATIYLTLICLLATGVTTMLRSSMFALAVLMPLLFLGSQGLGNIPKIKSFAQYLPDQAAMVIMHLTGPPGDPNFARDYGPWTGLAITALWTLAALIGGYLVLRRRDA